MCCGSTIKYKPRESVPFIKDPVGSLPIGICGVFAIAMAVVPVEHTHDATAEVEMDDLAEPQLPSSHSDDLKSTGAASPKCKPMYINTDNCVLRRTFSAPSGAMRDTECNSMQTPCLVSPSTRSSGHGSGNTTPKTHSNEIMLQLPRGRTYSTESSSHMMLNVDCSVTGGSQTSASPVSIGSPARRILQIRREESVDELTREVAKERDITSVLNLSKSLDETSWLGMKGLGGVDTEMMSATCSSSPSPVKFTDQKVSYNRSLTPSPISIPVSPKQTTYPRRSSISPSSLRPSALSSKRKLDTDGDSGMGVFTPAKRHMSMFYSPTNSHHNTLSSFSSSSSPERPSSDASHFSCDSDSGSEHGFTPMTNHVMLNSLLSCNNTHTTGFTSGYNTTTVTSRNTSSSYVAPQSPLAAKSSNTTSSNATLDNNNKQTTLNKLENKHLNNNSNYTFTPVKE